MVEPELKKLYQINLDKRQLKLLSQLFTIGAGELAEAAGIDVGDLRDLVTLAIKLYDPEDIMTLGDLIFDLVEVSLK